MNIEIDIKHKIDDRKVIDGAKKALAETMLVMEAEAVRKCPVDN